MGNKAFIKGNFTIQKLHRCSFFQVQSFKLKTENKATNQIGYLRDTNTVAKCSIHWSSSASSGSISTFVNISLALLIISLMLSGVKLWNSLKMDLRNSTSLPRFKKEYKKSLLQNYDLSN